MVSTYINNQCKYRLDKLQNVVYLISENALRFIQIDMPLAFVSGITETPIALKTTSINLSETDTLDERYQFTHTLNFTVNGYANHSDFEGRFYAIVKTLDGKYWLVNPLFPSKVTYEYTLDSNGSYTTFTMGTVSNHPTLIAVGFDAPTPHTCDGYNLCAFDRLMLNEKAYSSMDMYGNVAYSNDGFKAVVYDKNSQEFKEIFNGDTIQHQINFNIKFDEYKSAWHYNLLEFVDNTYAAVIHTLCGKYIMCGFNMGLQPSFNVTADETATPNNIAISLIDAANSGSFIKIMDEADFSAITETSWVYTIEYDAWECVSANTAMYLLKKQVDAFGNGTGHYLAYSGYTSHFEELGLIIDGEFDDIVTFTSTKCAESACTLSTTVLNTIRMRPQTCQTFELYCDSDWSITTSDSFLSFSPSTGLAHTQYTVEICNNVSQSTLVTNGSFTINYCNDKTLTSNVMVSKQVDTCFPKGYEFHINALAQWVNIPSNCCVESVSNSAITNVQIGNGYVKVYVPQNFTFTAKTYVLVFEMCDGTTVDVTIHQDRIYEQWVDAGRVCCLTQECTLLKRYTGLTPTTIDTYTYQTQFVDCEVSEDCTNASKWEQTSGTTCENGRKYWIEEEFVWNGTEWVSNGNQRIGEETVDSPAECSGDTPTYEYRWLLTSATTCVGTTKYWLYVRQQRISGSSDAWVDVIPTDTSIDGNGTMPTSSETNSIDCGYEPPIEPKYKWVTMNINTDYYCDECPSGTPQYQTVSTARTCDGVNEYAVNEYQVSYDGGSTWETLSSSTGSLISGNSYNCGYREQWVAMTGVNDYWCDGTTKKTMEKKQISTDSGQTWSDTNPLQTMSGSTVIEYNSEDCQEPIEPQYQTVSTARTCDGVNEYAVNEYQVSYDGGSTWETLSSSTGSLISGNSYNCGYRERTVSTATTCNGVNEYQLNEFQTSSDSGTTWQTISSSTGSLISGNSANCGYREQWVTMTGANDYWCDGTTKKTKEKKQISTDSGTTWTDTNPLQTRNGSTVIELNSEDCGYTPPTPPSSGYAAQYLTFVATTGNRFKFSKVVQYSLDSGQTWTTLAKNAYTPSVSVGQKIMWKGNEAPSGATFVSVNPSKFDVEGNIMSLLYGDDFRGKTSLSGDGFTFSRLFMDNKDIVNAENLVLPATTLTRYCYSSMFSGCSGLTTAPQLPATTLTQGCYNSMFYRCISLTTAPQLLATNLSEAYHCYESMFEGCTSLTTATSVLPATTLPTGCYKYMFMDCKALTTAPTISATTLSDYCCEEMFNGCSGLTTAPTILPATNLSGAYGCYRSMFKNCWSLTAVPQLPATTLEGGCYQYMFYQCYSLTTATELPATTLKTYCYYQMFYGCTSLSSITCLATNPSTYYSTTDWLTFVSSSGTFTKDSNTTWSTGSSGIPTNWTVQNYQS